jgi:hypothetical protein
LVEAAASPIREYTSLKIGWSDLNDVQETGQYPFRDGVITVQELEIAISQAARCELDLSVWQLPPMLTIVI